MVARPKHPIDKVRELQRRLYTSAKRRRERRFHALHDCGWQSDVLLAAWEFLILEACMLREKTIGKPYAGKPHVRFERGPQETEPKRHRA
jgi:hypothetical protein